MSFRLALEDEVDHSKEGAKYRIPDYGESPPLPPIPGSPAETPSPPKASPKSRLGRKSPNRSPNRSPKRSPNRSPPRASPPRPTSRGGRAASSSQPSADDIFGERASSRLAPHRLAPPRVASRRLAPPRAASPLPHHRIITASPPPPHHRLVTASSPPHRLAPPNTTTANEQPPR